MDKWRDRNSKADILTDEKNMWGATIKFTIKDGLETEFESKAQTFLEQAKVNEEGIVFYDLFMGEEKTYHWIEIFENKQTHETHFKQDATQDFFKFMDPLFEGKPEFRSFESV